MSADLCYRTHHERCDQLVDLLGVISHLWNRTHANFTIPCPHPPPGHWNARRMLAYLLRRRRIGTIAERNGAPSDVDHWGWICGFYPGCDPSEFLTGSAPDFEQARADFEAAWRIFSAKRSAADYEAWRDDRDWRAWKFAMWDMGMKIPTQTRDGTARCFCGATITISSVVGHVRAAHKTRPRAEALN